MKNLILVLMAAISISGNAQQPSTFADTAAITGLAYITSDLTYSLSRKYYDPKDKQGAMLLGLMMGVGMGMAVQAARLRFDSNDSMGILIGAGMSTGMRWQFDWDTAIFGK